MTESSVIILAAGSIDTRLIGKGVQADVSLASEDCNLGTPDAARRFEEQLGT